MWFSSATVSASTLSPLPKAVSVQTDKKTKERESNYPHFGEESDSGYHIWRDFFSLHSRRRRRRRPWFALENVARSKSGWKQVGKPQNVPNICSSFFPGASGSGGGGVIELHYPFRIVNVRYKQKITYFVCFVYAFIALLDGDKCDINSNDCDRIKQFPFDGPLCHNNLLDW